MFPNLSASGTRKELKQETKLNPEDLSSQAEKANFRNTLIDFHFFSNGNSGQKAASQKEQFFQKHQNLGIYAPKQKKRRVSFLSLNLYVSYFTEFYFFYQNPSP